MLQSMRRALFGGSRSLQYEIDLGVASVLLEAYKSGHQDLNYLREEEFISEEDNETKRYEARVAAEKIIEHQVCRLFEGLEAGLSKPDLVTHHDQMTPAITPPITPEMTSQSKATTSFDYKPPLKRRKKVEEQPLSAVDEQWDLALNKVRSVTGFTLEVKTSKIKHPAAGNGVFVQGNVSIGQVVALYPGKVYVPAFVKRLTARYLKDCKAGLTGTATESIYLDVFGSAKEPNPHAIQRHDGTTINAREGSVSCKPNVFAVGHKVNHPPKGVTPNVMLIPFDFMTDLVKEKRAAGTDFESFIPNEFCKDPSIVPNWWWYLREDYVHVPSIAYIATRPIKSGEELLINYRFNPELEHPDWYHAVDDEESKRRWD